jgi:hypothetical protein
MIQAYSAHQSRRARMQAQGLLSPGSGLSTAQVLSRICGVQAQDLSAARLSIRARSTGLTALQVEKARQEERTIAWIWFIRGTLHLVTTEDARWLIPFLGPALIAGDRRRFEQLGWNDQLAESATHIIVEAMHKHNTLTRPEIIQLLEKNGFPSQGQAPVHLLYRAALQATLCYGPDRGKDNTYVLFDKWLGESQPLARKVALAKFARRYLGAYGPAGPEDFARWSGLKRSEARQAWQLIADEIVQIEAAGTPAWLLKTSLSKLDEAFDSAVQVRLLPRFDTYLLGYTDRNLVVDPSYARRIHPGGGIIHPVLLVDGQATGTWKTKQRRANLEIQIEPFQPIADVLLPQIEIEVADLGRFLNKKTTFSITRPT